MKNKRLHLGCFDKPLNGWHNTDITPHIYISRIPGLSFVLFKLGLMTIERYDQHKKQVFNNVHYLNVAKRFPFPASTFDFVFTSHMLEHLYPWDAEYCLHEIYRVIKPGGIVRIAVPDLDKMLASYTAKTSDRFLNDFFENNQKNPKNQHHWHYNEYLLTKLLEQVGFSNIYRREFRQGNCEDIDLLDNRPESLFIECEK